MRRLDASLSAVCLLALVVGMACAPAASPSPTAAPAKPAAPASSGQSEAAKPAPAASPAAAAAAPAKSEAAKPAAATEELNQLIEGAKKESELSVALPSTATPDTIAKLEAAFNKTYGLNIKIKSTPSGAYERTLATILTEHKSGTKPTFDATVSDEFSLVAMQAAGASVPIKNWRALLPDGSPRDDSSISPASVEGWGMKFTDNTHIVVYNTKLITKEQLPNELMDLAKPEFKGKFSLPPFISTLSMLMLSLGQEKTLEAYRTLGKNEPKILSYNDGVARLVLGELNVVPLPNEYDFFRKRRAGDPVGMSVLKDFVPVTPRYMVVRQGATNPNAATLWVLFNAGPEAAKVWYETVNWLNVSYPNDDVRELQALLKETNAKTWNWLETESNLNQLKWVSTTHEGEEFTQKLLTAIQEGR